MESYLVTIDVTTDASGDFTANPSIGACYSYLDEIKIELPAAASTLPTTADVTITDPLPGKELLKLGSVGSASSSTFYRVRPKVQKVDGSDIDGYAERYMIKSPTLEVKVANGGNAKQAVIKIWLVR